MVNSETAIPSAPTDVVLPDMPLPFLQSICWQITAVETLTPQQMLDCYERGWRYRKLFGNLEAAEQQWIKTLAETFDSWLLVEL